MKSCIFGNAHRTTGIHCARANPITGIKLASAHRTTGIISAGCSIVCSINNNRFLRVKPAENQWIEVGQILDYSILSNCEWEIV